MLDRLLLASFLWTAWNAVWVFFVFGGAKAHRFETAALIFSSIAIVRLVTRGKRAEVATRFLTPFPAAAAVVVALLFAAIYIPLLSLPFLSDDYVFLAAARYPDAAGHWEFTRPAFTTAFTALARITTTVAVFRGVNILIHVANAVLVSILVSRLLNDRLAGVAAGCLFALNPLQLEAVLWISGLQELMWTSFALGALTIYSASATLTFRSALATAILVSLALASKETAVCLLFLVPAADAVLFRFRRGPMLRWMYALLAVALGVFAAGQLLHSSAAGKVMTSAPTRYWFKEMLTRPYERFVLPLNASEVSIAAAVVGLLALAWISIVYLAVRRGATSTMLAGPLVILASCLPVYTYFYVSPDLAGARYLYFAAGGWTLLILTALGGLRGTVVRSCIVAALLVASAACLYINARPWRVAGQIVEELRAADLTAHPAVVANWQARLGEDLKVEGGVPTEYRGVTIFRNGYPEFLRSIASSPPR